MRVAAIIIIIGLGALILAPAVLSQDFPEIDNEDASEELAQSLEWFSSHPVNLNHATLQDLSAIPLLYPSEALRMARYLESHPGITDPGLLVRDSVIAQQVLDDILPYICVDQPGRRERPTVELRSLAQAKTPPYTTVPDCGYPGPPWANLQKIRVCPARDWELTALTQKDPGEHSIADFFSASAAFTSRSAIVKVIVGDYQLAFGQGLLFGGSSPVFLSAQYMGRVGVNASRVTPNFSTNEWSSLRGAAVTAVAGNWLTVTGYLSARKRDGSRDTLGDLRSLDNSGYHREDSQLVRRGTIGERLAGLRLESDITGNLQLGLTSYGLSYTPGRPGQGRWQAGAGLDGSYTTVHGQLFLEAGMPQAHQPALIGGAQFATAGYKTFIMLRQYGRGYADASPRFDGLATYGGSDEQGATIGSLLALPGKTTAAAIYDLARPVSAASRFERGHGRDKIESFISNSQIPGLRFEWRWRRYHDDNGASDSFRTSIRTASRIGVRWQAGGAFAVTARYEIDRFRQDGDTMTPRGDLLSIGINGGPWNGLRVAATTVFFTAQSYDARLYAAEPELTGTGSFHAYYGSGRRDVLLVRYTYRRLLALECKVARQQRDSQRQTEGGLALTLTI